MRSQAKASSAGSTLGQNGSLKSSSNGSGAPSHRRLLVTAAAVLAVLAFAPSSQAKEAIKYIGPAFSTDPFGSGAGSFGGEFNGPGDSATSAAGVGVPAGTIYVADTDNNRVERFDKDGKFVSAWGKDVIASTVDERQLLAVDATGGSFQLTFNGVTTPPIDLTDEFGNPLSASTLEGRLSDLSSIGGTANVAVSQAFHGGFVIIFTGALAATDQSQITVNASQLDGTAKTSTLNDGTASTASTGTGFEVCTVVRECKAGVASGGAAAADNGALSAPRSVAVDGDTGNVYVSDRDNRRIVEYTPTGAPIRAFGWNVVASGPDNAAEFQTVAIAASGGSFTLSFGVTLPTETPPILYNASAAAVQSALEALGDVGGGDIAVSGPSGGPYTVRFVGALGDANQPLLGHDDSGLGGGTVNVSETVPGASADNYEICEAGVDVCQAGSGGAGAGRYGTGSFGPNFGMAISPPDSDPAAGTLYLADSGNRRVSTYSLDGTSFDSFGSSSNFGSGQPTKVTVDSRGIAYASDSNGSGEIDRFDTRNLYGGGVNSLLASIPASVNEVQHLNFSNFDSQKDSFKLTCPNGVDTGSIPYITNATGLQLLQEALSAACGVNSVVVNSPVLSEPGNWEVTFLGSLGSKNVAQMTCTVVSSVNGTCGVDTLTQGSTSVLSAGSTRGLAVDPVTNAVFVLRAPSGLGALTPGSAVVQQLGPVNDPGLIAPIVTADARHGGAAGFAGGVSGLGLDYGTGRIYVSDSGDNLGGSITHKVFILADPLPAPGMALSTVTTKTDTTATLTASVDPKGGLIKCTFQYSTDPGFVAPVDFSVADCNSFSPDGGYQTVSGMATGLTPNAQYFFRLKVTRALDSSSISTSEIKNFFTESVPPAVSDIGAIQVQDTSARFVGTIDPKNSPTGYIFQYGPTPALGFSTPALDIGGGGDLITVSRVVGGLDKDTDYFFHLVATNEFGTTSSPSRTFHTRAVPFPLVDPGNCSNQALRESQGATFLSDCRAYEQVSPPDKNQGGVDQFLGNEYRQGFSQDGNAAAFCTNALFGDPAGEIEVFCAPYLSLRSATGWQTTDPFPRYCHFDRNGMRNAGQEVWLNPSFDRAVVLQPDSSYCAIPPIDGSAQDQASNLYRQDLGSDPFDYDLLGPNPPNDTQGRTLRGSSEDFSHIVYRSSANQTPDSPEPEGTYYKLYDWEANGHGTCMTPGGCLNLVSKKPDGSPFTSSSDVASTGNNLTNDANSNAVSSSGDRIYFQNGDGPSQKLYLREDGVTTYDVSAPECAVPADCGANASVDEFLWGSPGGDAALFLSCDKLTDASAAGTPCSFAGFDNSKVYRWDRNGSIGDRLTDLTLDHEPADGSQPDAVGILGASDEGTVVYLVASGQLVAGKPTEKGLKLYRVRVVSDGEVTTDYLGPYVSTEVSKNGIRTSTTDLLATDLNTQPVRFDRVTPDGRYLMLTTTLALDPAADRDTSIDAYRWDEKGGWTCASCQLPGSPSAGDVDAVYPECCDILQTVGNPSHEISDDGQRIFFQTLDALLPQDTNGEAGCPAVRGTNHSGVVFACQDIYEWHDGTLSLVSPGSGKASVLIGATASGDDVFFVTSERLVGWDTDIGADLYDARAGGGFAEPAPAPPPCDLEAGGCEGPNTVAPSAVGAGTAVFEGPGDAAAPPTCRKGLVKRRGQCVRKKPRHHKHRRQRQHQANDDRRTGR